MSDFTSYGSPIPRKPKLAAGMAKDRGRIRWLEVNKRQQVSASGPICGVAQYGMTFPGAPAGSSYTPDCSGLALGPGALDTIGCTPQSWGLEIPPEWMWWASVRFTLAESGSPTPGDVVEWGISNAGVVGAPDVAVQRYDPMLDVVNQFFADTVHGISGLPPGYFPPDGVSVGGWSTALGSLFTPVSLEVSVMALFPFDCYFNYIIV